MSESQTGRMLLSHNFDISEDILPQLNREEFTQVFINGLSQQAKISCRQLNHPHWIVEILFSSDDFSPAQIGSICAQAVVDKRMNQTKSDASQVEILIIGGLKKTPPLSDSPDALQTGEWGVDVVETQSAKDFLIAMDWEGKTADKTMEEVFKIERQFKAS